MKKDKGYQEKKRLEGGGDCKTISSKKKKSVGGRGSWCENLSRCHVSDTLLLRFQGCRLASRLTEVELLD